MGDGTSNEFGPNVVAEAPVLTYLWAPDLGRDVGSARWLGELAVLVCCIFSALAMWPGLHLSFELDPWMDPLHGRMERHYDLVRKQAAAEERRDIVVATLRPQESVAQLFLRMGISSIDAQQAETLIDADLFPGRLQEGSQVTITLGPKTDGGGEGRFLTRARLRPRLDLTLVVDRREAGLVLARQAIPVEISTERLRGHVGSDLATSILAAGGTPAAVHEFRDLLKRQFNDSSDVSPRDTFDIVTTRRRAVDGGAEGGEFLYAALFRGDYALLEVLRWGNDDRLLSIDGAEPAAFHGAGVWPVNGRLTSGFGLRFHPVLGYARLHAGIDIGAPMGTPIYAASSGTVAFAGRHGGHGKYVRLDHRDGRGTGYAHMSRIAVSAGERVATGQLIGYVGSTGLSTGPHLHYEVYSDGRSVDPLKARIRRPNAALANREEIAGAVAVLKALSPVAKATAHPVP